MKKTPTPTGRFARSEPEMQNLPGTLAHKLEMHFAKHGYPKGIVTGRVSFATPPGCGMQIKKGEPK